MEEVEAEVEQAAGHRLAIHQHMLLDQVPAARADEQHGHFVAQRVFLAVGAGIADRAPDRVAQVELPADHVGPGRRVGVLEVGHEHTGAGVQRVDDHLPIGRPGDLDAAVLEIGRDGRDLPVGGADGCGLGQEVGVLAGVKLGLALGATLQQGLAGGTGLTRASFATNASASGVRISAYSDVTGATISTPSG